jgi:predicted transcriptional regulator
MNWYDIPTRERCLKMVEFGYTHKEIAEALGISLSAVQQQISGDRQAQIHKIRKRLKCECGATVTVLEKNGKCIACNIQARVDFVAKARAEFAGIHHA